MQLFLMTNHHNSTINLSHAPFNNKSSLSGIDQEIKMGELRLRYVKLMRDFHTTLGEKIASDLIKESAAIWEKLRIRKNT